MARVRYRGPYPTEQLFTALLECFRYDAAVDDPLGRFMDERRPRLDARAPRAATSWRPASPSSSATRSTRSTLDGAAFYGRDWQGVIRHEPRVVREEGARVRLLALGARPRARGSARARSVGRGAGAARAAPRPHSARAAAPGVGPGPGRAHRPRERPCAGFFASRASCAALAPRVGPSARRPHARRRPNGAAQPPAARGREKMGRRGDGRDRSEDSAQSPSCSRSPDSWLRRRAAAPKRVSPR